MMFFIAVAEIVTDHIVGVCDIICDKFAGINVALPRIGVGNVKDVPRLQRQTLSGQGSDNSSTGLCGPNTNV